MAKKSAISGEYIITVEDSGTVRVCKIYYCCPIKLK